MNKLTEHFIKSTKYLTPVEEVTPGNHGFMMFNDGGVEVEVAELLHSLVKVWKPDQILETGTHLGISTLYMAQALQENKKGFIYTCEIIPELQAKAVALWKDLSLTHRITSVLKPSLELEWSSPIDFLFLDSEPQLRFDEFVKYFPLVTQGGLIIIHDLHPSMGHHGQTYHGQYDWPYGFWANKLSSYVEKNFVQIIHAPNPRGMTIFQKTKPDWEISKHIEKTRRNNE